MLVFRPMAIDAVRIKEGHVVDESGHNPSIALGTWQALCIWIDLCTVSLIYFSVIPCLSQP